MKTIIKSIGCFLVIIASLESLAQNPQGINPDFIAGKWRINLEETINAIPEHTQASYDSLSTTAKDQMSSDMTDQQFLFREDGTYESIVVNGDTYPGNWTYDGKMLQIVFTQGGSMAPILISASHDQLVFRIINDPVSTEFFHYLFLTLIER